MWTINVFVDLYVLKLLESLETPFCSGPQEINSHDFIAAKLQRINLFGRYRQ
jgi:hypothetical protein